MKNFFEHQARAKQTTHYLLFLFSCAITSTIAAFYVTIITIAVRQNVVSSIWQPLWLLGTAIWVCLIIGFGSAYKMNSLRGGGAVVAQSLGGQLISQHMADGQERQLLNVVEEMAIASGIAVPDVYLLPEASINAFAAGLTPNRAVIGVTRGALSKLNRDQLQGVIGHEFSHIVNGDMALNLKLMGLIHGLLLIHLGGREMAFNGHRRSAFSDRDGNQFAWLAFAFAMMIIGGIGWIFGQLIKSAISRQREFLADASAVQFTRNPEGIADALRCIAQQSHQSRISSAAAESASHLFFNNVSFIGSIATVFSTHPPLEVRIRRLGGASASLPNTQKPSVSSIANGISAQQSAIAGASGFAPDAVVANIGTVTPAHLTQAQSILSHLPDGLLQAARTQAGAVAVTYGLLLDTKESVRSHQKQIVASSSKTVHSLVEDMESLFAGVPSASRLPLLELCIPSLKTLKPDVAIQFFNRVKELVKADGKLSLSEYALQAVLQYRLAPHFRPEPIPAVSYAHLNDIWPDCLVLISALAKTGYTKPAQIDYAFRNGLSQLPGVAKQSIPTVPPSHTLHDVSLSLSRLRQAVPKLKQAIAEACAHTVLTDGQTTDQESELLRAILIALGCPIPPFLNAVAQNAALAA